MVEDPATGTVGFVIPRLSGAYFRNLFFDFVPALEAQLTSLREEVDAQRTLSDNLQQQVGVLTRTRDNLQQQTSILERDQAALQTRLDAERAERQRQERLKRRWRTATIVLGGTTTVLGLITAVN